MVLRPQHSAPWCWNGSGGRARAPTGHANFNLVRGTRVIFGCNAQDMGECHSSTSRADPKLEGETSLLQLGRKGLGHQPSTAARPRQAVCTGRHVMLPKQVAGAQPLQSARQPHAGARCPPQRLVGCASARSWHPRTWPQAPCRPPGAGILAHRRRQVLVAGRDRETQPTWPHSRAQLARRLAHALWLRARQGERMRQPGRPSVRDRGHH